jgi:predicted NBD/HSP70 family sugar kinase
MQANYKEDSRIVLTLDAGGTKFEFSAMAAGDQIVEATETPSHADNLDLCLRTIVTGFAHVMSQLPEKPSAISFAFPGRRGTAKVSSAISATCRRFAAASHLALCSPTSSAFRFILTTMATCLPMAKHWGDFSPK